MNQVVKEENNLKVGFLDRLLVASVSHEGELKRDDVIFSNDIWITYFSSILYSEIQLVRVGDLVLDFGQENLRFGELQLSRRPAFDTGPDLKYK